MLLAAIVILAATNQAESLERQQARAPRVKQARAAKTERVASLFAKAGVAYPPAQILLRAYKSDAVLQLWAGDRGQQLQLIASYAICSRSGDLGPKRRQGDLQVPEGFYRVERFNAWSNFHLSFGINYPNASDRILGYRPNLGGDIFIHGDCVTIGCIPIENEPIRELYLIALDTFLAGHTVHVHIFPGRLDREGLTALAENAGDDSELIAFWRGLSPGWEHFEKNKRLPRISVDSRTGAYRVGSSSAR